MQSKNILTGIGLLTAIVLAGNWNVDAPKAKINFSVKGPFGTVHGSLSGLKATIQFDEKSPQGGSFSAIVDPNTISTGIGMRNHDLKNEEIWLNTKKYPEIGFRSKKIEKTDKGFKAMGELTLKGITKPVEIPFTFSGNGSTGVFKGEFTINREEYNVGKKGGSVGDNIAVTLEVPVTK
ncbi:MAG TPA: YceI family protein [Puia sp.]|nr:YceI family protein [Puia sp.]